MWDERGLCDREEPSLVSQLKCIEHNLLTKTERGEIERNVKMKIINEDGARQNRMVISRNEWDELFGESDNDEEFLGFEIDSDMEDKDSLKEMDDNYEGKK